MREELQEILEAAKRESTKSVLGAVAVVALALLSYNHFSGGPSEEEITEVNQDTSRKIASIGEKPTFKRKIPSVDISIDEKEKKKEEKEEEEPIDAERQRLDRAEKEKTSTAGVAQAQNPTRSSDENADIFEEEYVDDSSGGDDNPVAESKQEDKPNILTSNGCVGDSCPPPPGEELACKKTGTCTCEQLGNCPPPDILACPGPGCTPPPPEESCPGPGCPQACTPTMVVFPDQGPGTYSSNPTIRLSSAESKDIYYCVTSIPGSCDPEPSLDGLPYTSSFNIGVSDGNYILSFLANEDSCAKKYAYSYEVNSSKPDVQVTFSGGQYLQTTEQINYQMDSANSGDSNYYFWLLKLGGATDFTDCKTMAEGYSLAGFGLDLLLSDSSPDETDLNSIATPYSLNYTSKTLLNYGNTGSQFISIVSDRSSGSPSSYQYGCRMNQVFLMDFPAFDFKTTYGHDINGNGELEFTGGFQSYDAGRYPASGNDSYLEIGFENITN